MSAGRILVVGCFAAVLAAGAGLLSGCGRSERIGEGGEPVVVATVWPLANLAEQIVSERARVVALVPPGRSPHGFEPSGEDAEALHNAELVVMVGMGFDSWAREAFERYGGDEASLLVFADAVGLEPRRARFSGHGDEHENENERGGGHEHRHAAPSPHLWLDPVLTRRFVGALGERLAAAFPEASGAIERRTQALAADIERIDKEYRAALSDFGGRRIVTFHNAFDRLAERYGLRVAATLTPIESPGALTPERVERALKVIEEHGVRAVFAEPQFPATATQALRADSGVRVLTLDPLGDPNRPGRDSYQALMRYNLRTLVRGMPDD